MQQLDDDQVALIAALTLRDLAPNASLAIQAASMAAGLMVNMSGEQRKRCIVHAARVTASARRGYMGGTKC